MKSKNTVKEKRSVKNKSGTIWESITGENPHKKVVPLMVPITRVNELEEIIRELEDDKRELENSIEDIELCYKEAKDEIADLERQLEDRETDLDSRIGGAVSNLSDISSDIFSIIRGYEELGYELDKKKVISQFKEIRKDLEKIIDDSGVML